MPRIKETQEAVKNIINVSNFSVKEWCSTGSTLLDLAITNNWPGGIPIGRIIQIYGGFSAGKSAIACSILGSALRKDFLGFYADVEYTFDSSFASLYGLDVNNPNFFWGYSWKNEIVQPTSLEELFDDWIYQIIEKFQDKKKILVIDSLTALPAKVEAEKRMEDHSFGAYRAKQISLGLRKYLNKLIETNTSLILIDQTRDNIGAIFGESEITTGGRAAEFYTSLRIHLQHEAKIQNSIGRDIGVWIKFKIDKNKVSIPFRTGYLKIEFSYGIDDIAGNLRFLAEFQTNSKREGMKKTTNVTLNLDGEQQTKTIKAWIPYIEEHNLEKALQQEVVKTWKDLYKEEERKPRVWE